MHKPIVFLLLFVNYLGFSQVEYVADGYELKISSEIKPKTNESFKGLSGDFAFISGYRKGVVYVSKVDSETLTSVWSTTLDGELKQNKTVFDYYKTIILNNQVHIIYMGYNEKENDLVFVEKVLDENGTIDKSVVLAHFPVFEKDDYNANVFTTPDKEHLLLRVITGTNGRADLTSHFIWLDKSFNVLEQDKINTKQKGAFSSIKSEAISNQMNYALTVFSKLEFDTDLLIFNHFMGKGKIKHTLTFKKSDLLSADIAFNPYKDEITVSGYYGEKNKKTSLIKGFFHSVLNRENFDSISERRFNINELMHNDLASEKNALDKFFTGGKGLITIQYLDTYFTEEKGKYIAYEVLEKYVTRDSQGITTVYWKPKDYLIMHYDNEHKFNFYSIITAAESAVFPSQLSSLRLNGFIENDNLVFYYTMLGKQNAEAYPENEALVDFSNRHLALHQAVVSHTKKVSVNTVLVYRIIMDHMKLGDSGVRNNTNPYDLYFTFYGGSSMSKTTLCHLYKDSNN